MRRFGYILAAGLACAATAGFAQETDNGAANAGQTSASSQEPPQDEETSEQDARMQEVVCRTEPVTGSRTRVNRTCMTRAEWRTLEGNYAKDIRDLQGSAAGGHSCRQDAMGGCR